MTRSRTPIDWSEVHARLERGRRAIEAGLRPDEARVRGVLEERARMLSQRGSHSEANRAFVLLIIFRIGASRYGLPLSAVTAVCAAKRCTGVSGGGREIFGLISDAGRVESVIDAAGPLREAFGAPGTGHVLHVRSGEGRVSLRVDAVEDLIRISLDEIAAPILRGGEPSAHLQGVLPNGVAVLRPEALGALAPHKEVES